MRTFVTAVFLAKDGQQEEVEKTFRSIVDPTHADPGCVSYALNRDQDEPRHLVFMEEWESRDLLEQHLDARHVTEALEAVEDKLESSQIIVLERLAGGDVES